jgi:hypothetical protein
MKIKIRRGLKENLPVLDVENLDTAQIQKNFLLVIPMV